MTLRFEPWTGSKYETTGIADIRVLIIGESHYGIDSEASTEFTTEVVNNCVYLDEYPRRPFFKKVSKLVLRMQTGQYLSDELHRDTWDRVAFYNYIQDILPAARMRPTGEMWEHAERVFPIAIAKLNPDLVIVMGKELRRHFPTSLCKAEVCFTEHPSSSSFTYLPWIVEIQDAIDRLRPINSAT
jgi:hypothetical protein